MWRWLNDASQASVFVASPIVTASSNSLVVVPLDAPCPSSPGSKNGKKNRHKKKTKPTCEADPVPLPVSDDESVPSMEIQADSNKRKLSSCEDPSADGMVLEMIEEGNACSGTPSVSQSSFLVTGLHRPSKIQVTRSVK